MSIKKIFGYLSSSAILAVAVTLVIITSCGDKGAGPAGAATYMVTVSSAGANASGGGSYAGGAMVNITAGTPPAGMQFSSWTTASAGVTFANPNSAKTSFTMPTNAVTVTAVFESSSDPTISKFAVTVSSAGADATGNGSYAAGETVVIFVGTPPVGMRFNSWTSASAGVTFANPNSATTTFTMPANAVTVTAVFEPSTGIAPTVYAVIVSSAGTGAVGSDSYTVGAIVEISAGTPPTGQQFKYWTVTSGDATLTNPNSAITTFTMPANAVTVTATFEPSTPISYLVMVSSVGTGAYGTDVYRTAGETAEIFAGTPPTGKQFKNWTITEGSVTLADTNSARTTFSVPNYFGRVKLTAVFVLLADEYGTSTDARDGKAYRTIKMPDGKTWMAENLNYEPSSGNSWCYENSVDSCNKYGRLYDWTTAMNISIYYGSNNWNGGDVNHQGVCPAGWHLPSRAELSALIAAVGSPTAGQKLKSISGWDNNGNGTDEYGFSALPGGGIIVRDGRFVLAGRYGNWWSTTDHDRGYADILAISYQYNVAELSGGIKAADGISVRCVQND